MAEADTLNQLLLQHYRVVLGEQQAAGIDTSYMAHLLDTLPVLEAQQVQTTDQSRAAVAYRKALEKWFPPGMPSDQQFRPGG